MKLKSMKTNPNKPNFKRDLRLTPVPAFSVPAPPCFLAKARTGVAQVQVRAAQVRAGVWQNISAIRKGFVRIYIPYFGKQQSNNRSYVL